MTRLEFHKSFGDISAVIRERHRDQKLRQQCLQRRIASAHTDEADSMEDFWHETTLVQICPASHYPIKET